MQADPVPLMSDKQFIERIENLSYRKIPCVEWEGSFPNECHDNVEKFCKQRPGTYRVVGWCRQGGLYYYSHSVVGFADCDFLVCVTDNGEDATIDFAPDEELVFRPINRDRGRFYLGRYRVKASYAAED